MHDPDLSSTGHAEVQCLSSSHEKLLKQISVAYVSPLYRALRTALSILPASVKIIVTRDVAEIASDKFARDGMPKDHTSGERIAVKQPENSGRTRRELEGLLKLFTEGRAVEWIDIAMDEQWWDSSPDSKEEVHAKIQHLADRVRRDQENGVQSAIIGHSMWMKVAIPCSMRPKGTPNPLGTAAHFWPKNSTPYRARFIDGALSVYEKLDSEHELDKRDIVLIRHGHSEAQMQRKMTRCSNRLGSNSDVSVHVENDMATRSTLGSDSDMSSPKVRKSPKRRKLRIDSDVSTFKPEKQSGAHKPQLVSDSQHVAHSGRGLALAPFPTRQRASRTIDSTWINSLLSEEAYSAVTVQPGKFGARIDLYGKVIEVHAGSQADKLKVTRGSTLEKINDKLFSLEHMSQACQGKSPWIATFQAPPRREDCVAKFAVPDMEINLMSDDEDYPPSRTAGTH